MFFIPGPLIALATFPGVIVHELAHQLFCRWFRIPVLTVCYFLIWLGVSIAMHAIPSTGDAKSMWQSVKDVSPVTRLLVMPIVGVIYLATIGRFFWLDLFYGIGVAIGCRR
jgi:MFS-type transporter involved in bile tolerance (Atg22 family)